MLSLIKSEHGKRAVAKIIAKLDEKIVERIVYLVRWWHGSKRHNLKTKIHCI